jgi:hypothetical protein
MKTGAAVALGIGGFLLLSRQASAQSAASSPVTAAANSLASLESSLLKSLSTLTKPAAPKPAAPKSAGGSGLNPAGGSGSGRSAGGTTPVIPVEDAFPNFNGTNVIDVGPTGGAFEPGGIFSDPTQFAGNEADLSTSPAEDPSAENSLIDSLTQQSSGVPIFDPGPDDPGQDFGDEESFF